MNLIKITLAMRIFNLNGDELHIIKKSFDQRFDSEKESIDDISKRSENEIYHYMIDYSNKNNVICVSENVEFKYFEQENEIEYHRLTFPMISQ